MLTLLPQALIAAAQVLLGFGEQSAKVRGRLVEGFLRGAGRPLHAAWDLAFVLHVGWWSQRDAGGTYSLWPLPRTATHADLAVIARECGMIRVIPVPGDVVLYRVGDQAEYTRSGIIIAAREEPPKPGRPYSPIPRYVCKTIEGNLTEHGVFGGMYIREMRRVLSPTDGDLFIRWAELDGRHTLGDPTARTTRRAGRPVLLVAKTPVAEP